MESCQILLFLQLNSVQLIQGYKYIIINFVVHNVEWIKMWRNKMF